MELKTNIKAGLVMLIVGLLWLTPSLYAQRIFIPGLPDPQAPEDSSVIDMYIGGQLRIIPTIEENWDLGMMSSVKNEIKKAKWKTNMIAVAEGTAKTINQTLNIPAAQVAMMPAAQQVQIATLKGTLQAMGLSTSQVSATDIIGLTGLKLSSVNDLSDLDAAIRGSLLVAALKKANFDPGISIPTASPLAILKLKAGSDIDPRVHTIEAGRVANEYWRTESRLNFEFDPQDKTWNLFWAVECDTIMDTEQVDARCHNFGLERLNAMIDIPSIHSQLHMGWDIYYVDAIVKLEPNLTVGGPIGIYGDDDPGIWLSGENGSFSWQVGLHKKTERNGTQSEQTRGSEVDGFARHPEAEYSDADRMVSDLTIGYAFEETRNAFKFILAQDRSNAASDATAQATARFAGRDEAETIADNAENMRVLMNYYGLMYHGTFASGILEVTGEFVSQTGEAVNTEICSKASTVTVSGSTSCKSGGDDYSINANLMYLNVTSGIWRGSGKGTGAKLGISILTTSGDGEDDNELTGYTGVNAGQRFSQQIGTEHSFYGEQNPFVLGTQVYGYLPEYHGSRGVFGKQGVPVGGLGLGRDILDKQSQGGRGDNPGLTLWNLRLDARFTANWFYQMNYRMISFNEPFYPYLTTGFGGTAVTTGAPVTDTDMGTEWANEITYQVNWNVVIQFSYALFTPGPGIESVSRVYTGDNSFSPTSASRTAMEFITKF
ncbi:hypothetical protein WDW89_06195 [Deltaproteobacteria bacterium TL4]